MEALGRKGTWAMHCGKRALTESGKAFPESGEAVRPKRRVEVNRKLETNSEHREPCDGMGLCAAVLTIPHHISDGGSVCGMLCVTTSRTQGWQGQLVVYHCQRSPLHPANVLYF